MTKEATIEQLVKRLVGIQQEATEALALLAVHGIQVPEGSATKTKRKTSGYRFTADQHYVRTDADHRFTEGSINHTLITALGKRKKPWTIVDLTDTATKLIADKKLDSKQPADKLSYSTLRGFARRGLVAMVAADGTPQAPHGAEATDAPATADNADKAVS